MTRAEMLKRMGLTEEEYRLLLLKFGWFYASLTASQKAIVNRALPSLRRAARSLGRDVKKEDLQEILASPADGEGMFGELEEVAQVILNKTDDDDNGNN